MDKNTISIKSGIKELGIFEKHSDAWVSSRDLALYFGKEHFHVLRDIEDKIIPFVTSDFTQSNFGFSKYKDKSGKSNKEYLLNRKSFTLLAMGFTGKKAMEFKVKYIEAFEAMHNVIETRLLSKEGYREMTAAIAEKYDSDAKTFSAEANMINEIILGMKAKDFKSVNNIDEKGNTRDSVAFKKLENLDKAQRLNAQMIKGGLHFNLRKEIILSNFKPV